MNFLLEPVKSHCSRLCPAENCTIIALPEAASAAALHLHMKILSSRSGMGKCRTHRTNDIISHFFLLVKCFIELDSDFFALRLTLNFAHFKLKNNIKNTSDPYFLLSSRWRSAFFRQDRDFVKVKFEFVKTNCVIL